MKLVAYTVKGIEQIVAKEIRHKLPRTKLDRIDTKRVLFELDGISKDLLDLRSADDLGILIDEFKATSLEIIVQRIKNIDLTEAITAISDLRPVAPNQFSITATVAGFKNQTGPEVARTLGENLSQAWAWEYTEEEHTNFDLRVFINHGKTSVAVRLTSNPLHVRPYKAHCYLQLLLPWYS